jgi:hypothetical protein
MSQLKTQRLILVSLALTILILSAVSVTGIVQTEQVINKSVQISQSLLDGGVAISAWQPSSANCTDPGGSGGLCGGIIELSSR